MFFICFSLSISITFFSGLVSLSDPFLGWQGKQKSPPPFNHDTSKHLIGICFQFSWHARSLSIDDGESAIVYLSFCCYWKVLPSGPLLLTQRRRSFNDVLSWNSLLLLLIFLKNSLGARIFIFVCIASWFSI